MLHIDCARLAYYFCFNKYFVIFFIFFYQILFKVYKLILKPHNFTWFTVKWDLKF